MASFKIDIQPDKIVKTLTFRGHDFVNTWVEDKIGSHTLEISFEGQIEKQYPEISTNVLRKIEEFDCVDEDEAQEIVQYLTDCEE